LFLLFATGVIDTGGKFAAGVVDTWCTLTCEYLREFSKKFDTLGRGKLIHEKIQKQKIS
jgi:hypothetical protein